MNVTGSLFNDKVKQNPFKTKKDVKDALKDLCKPLAPFFQEQSPGHLFFGSSGSYYSEDRRGAEGFLRCLWGIAPLIAGGEDITLFDNFKAGIIEGTNPDSPAYWGEISNSDQLMVEMAALSLTLLLLRERFWDQLTRQQQDNLYHWLIQINQYSMPESNWQFFRVLVNIAMKKCGREYSAELLEDAVTRIDTFYLGDGWYSDGHKDQIDYYISFALHFYGLIYAVVMADDDPDRAIIYKKRATIFAQSFKEWFSIDGAALPFGRSLTYRFAQVSFWSALAFAGVEALPWGIIKGIVLRNLRYWFSKPIFTSDGLLSIGYGYQNLNMAEGYNAPGSPYWAFKTFLILALPDTHPFWQAEEADLAFTEKSVQIKSRMIVCHDKGGKEVQAFTAGQHARDHAHGDAKYEKFVYSTTFGFSVAKSGLLLKQGAFDSCLALAECDGRYRSRYGCVSYKIEEEYIESIWRPWNDVEIKSIIVPLMPWHVRIHIIQTDRMLDTAEGAFAVPITDADRYITKGKAFAKFDGGISGIIDYNGNREAQILMVEPNTNLIHPRTVIPTITSRIDTGTHLLVSSVLGDIGTFPEDTWEKSPFIRMTEKEVTILYADKKIKITLN